MSNRVEHQKLSQVAVGWVFGFNLGFPRTQALIKIKKISRGKTIGWVFLQNLFCFNRCLCLPKAELNTRNSARSGGSTSWQLCCHRVEFLMLNLITHAGKKVTRLTRETMQLSLFSDIYPIPIISLLGPMITKERDRGAIVSGSVFVGSKQYQNINTIHEFRIWHPWIDGL